MKAPSIPQLAFAVWAFLLVGEQVRAFSTIVSSQKESTDTTFPKSRYERFQSFLSFQARNQANDGYTTAEARSLSPDAPDTHKVEEYCDLKFLSFDPPYISSEAIAIVCSSSDEYSALKRSILNCWESKFGNIEGTFHAVERHCSHISDDPFRHSSVTSPSTWLHPQSLCLVCVVMGVALLVWSVRGHNRNGQHDCIERQLPPEKEDKVHAKDFH
jgi:hypothetical protein